MPTCLLCRWGGRDGSGPHLLGPGVAIRIGKYISKRKKKIQNIKTIHKKTNKKNQSKKTDIHNLNIDFPSQHKPQHYLPPASTINQHFFSFFFRLAHLPLLPVIFLSLSIFQKRLARQTAGLNRSRLPSSEPAPTSPIEQIESPKLFHLFFGGGGVVA